MGRYHHDFEPDDDGGKSPLPRYKRTSINFFLLVGFAFFAGFVLPLLSRLF